MEIDLRVLELLSSKICHDLISPVSAINNGVELIEDIGGSVVDEAMNLIGNSAGQASRRLKLFRIAYGRAGSEENLPIRDVRQVAESYFSVGKTKLLWEETLDLQAFADRRGALKTLVNLLIVGEEILAYGGAIALRRLAEPDTLGCRLEISGRSAALSDAFRAALDGVVPVEELTPRTVQPYIAGRFASTSGIGIASAAPQEDRLDLILSTVSSAYNKHQEA